MFGKGKFHFHRRFGTKDTHKKDKIIFLDIDGVLNCSDSSEDMDDACLAELQKIVQATNAKIVLTSSWKFYFLRGDENMTKAYFTQRLADYGLAIYDIAPDLGSGKRGAEITQWLQQHKEAGNFVILDDCFFPDFQKLKKHVCLTDWNKNGLTAAHREKAIQILNYKTAEQTAEKKK